MMTTEMIFLLLMNWLGTGIAASHLARHWQQTVVPCTVSAEFDPQLASAYLEKEVPSFGCVGNGTSKKKNAEVHVIYYHGNQKQNVELQLDDYNKRGFNEPFVLVLSSNVTVYWQVRLRRNPKHLHKHTFVVSSGSGLRFAYKHLESRPIILKPKHLPQEVDDLFTWVTKRFSIVTTFTSVQGGSLLTTVIGKAHALSTQNTLPSSCILNKNLDQQEYLNVKAVSMEKQPVEGCLMKDRLAGSSSGLAYVVELKDVPDVKQFEVVLDLRGHSGHHGDSQLCLVLKSPTNVMWRVNTKKIHGRISIVANSFVDMAGVRVSTVSVRSEELQESGMDLLHWVEYFLKPVAMYTAVSNSNKIKISLPDQAEKEQRTAKQIRIGLRQSLKTECNLNTLTVAVDKIVLQMLGIKKSMLTLLDPQCIASENLTHVYMESTSQACGTNFIRTTEGGQALVNALVLHDSNIIIEEVRNSDFLVEGSGLEDVFSGSGESELNDLMLDDEDLQLRPLQINFMCLIKQQIVEKPDLHLQLFKDVLFLAPYTRFPLTVSQPHSRLYLEATATSDPLLKAKLESCWLTPELDTSALLRYALIENSCAADDSIQYLQTGPPQSERLSFTLENYMKQTTSLTGSAILKCQIGFCCINKKCGSYSYPLCPDHSLECDPNQHRHQPDSSSGSTSYSSHLIVLGTLILPAHITVYTEDTKQTSDVLEGSSKGQSSEGSKDPVVIEGLDSGTVVGIAFAAFIIGAMMMGALWFIHTHSGSLFSSGPFKRSLGPQEMPEQEEGYAETTPGSSVPIST